MLRNESFEKGGQAGRQAGRQAGGKGGGDLCSLQKRLANGVQAGCHSILAENFARRIHEIACAMKGETKMTYETEQLLLTQNQLKILDKRTSNCISVRAYADLHGVHKHTVLNWIKTGKIAFFAADHGKYYRFFIPADEVPPMRRPDRCA